MQRIVFSLAAGIALSLFSAGAWAAAEVTGQETGTVAAIQGTLRVQRGEVGTDLTLGAPLYAGDKLRTGPGDRAKLVFLDESVVDMAPSSEIVLQIQQFDPVNQKYQSTIDLNNGKVRVGLGDRYTDASSRYEVETPTAVALRGSEFIVAYSATTEVTEVVSLTGQVDVLGKLAVMSDNVEVSPETRTEIKKGKFPTTPVQISAERISQYMVGLSIAGTGRRDGLNVLHPVVVGKLMSAQDVPGGAARGEQSGQRLSVRAPRPFLAEEMSADVRVNTQPLLEYRRVQPGLGESGSIDVDF